MSDIAVLTERLQKRLRILRIPPDGGALTDITAPDKTTVFAGEPGSPHDHSRRLKILRGGADATDGLDATSMPLGKSFPGGLVIAMNSGPRNLLVFRWEEFATAGEPKFSPPRRQRASSKPGVSDF